MEVLLCKDIAICINNIHPVNFTLHIQAVKYWISVNGIGWGFRGVMQLTLRDNLPFLQVTVGYQGVVMGIPHVLVDTGSATTMLAADMVAAIHIVPSPQDILYTIRGVGGTEVVFSRQVDYIQVGEQRVTDFTIEVGGMDYGFDINGIVGMDFLTQAGAVINLREISIEFVDSL
jgi:hypothetical protein